MLVNAFPFVDTSFNGAYVHRCRASSGLVQTQCREGHRGVLCAVCEARHIRQQGVCQKCAVVTSADGSTGIAVFATVPPFLLFLGLLVFFIRVKRDAPQNNNNNKKKKSNKNTTKVSPALKGGKDASNTKKKKVRRVVSLSGVFEWCHFKHSLISFIDFIH